MLHVLKKAESLSWHLVASADVSADYIKKKDEDPYPVDVHSWYFVFWPHRPGKHSRHIISSSL